MLFHPLARQTTPADLNPAPDLGCNTVEGSLLDQGFELMLIGMGTVFIFLTLLVFATKAMSALATRLQGEPEIPTGGAAAPSNDGEVVAAITAAIAQHRSASTSSQPQSQRK